MFYFIKVNFFHFILFNKKNAVCDLHLYTTLFCEDLIWNRAFTLYEMSKYEILWIEGLSLSEAPLSLATF